MASGLELGASDVELGATDLELTVDGSSFPKIQMLQSIAFARFPLLLLDLARRQNPFKRYP